MTSGEIGWDTEVYADDEPNVSRETLSKIKIKYTSVSIINRRE